MIQQVGTSVCVRVPMIIGNARALLEGGRRLLCAGATTEVLDLAAVAEVDSSALSLVLAWLRTANERGIALRIAHPPASLISLAALYGVSELLPLV